MLEAPQNIQLCPVHHSSIHLPMSIGDIYSAWELKISESPPSKIAMVEHR